MSPGGSARRFSGSADFVAGSRPASRPPAVAVAEGRYKAREAARSAASPCLRLRLEPAPQSREMARIS